MSTSIIFVQKNCIIMHSWASPSPFLPTFFCIIVNTKASKTGKGLGIRVIERSMNSISLKKSRYAKSPWNVSPSRLRCYAKSCAVSMYNSNCLYKTCNWQLQFISNEQSLLHCITLRAQCCDDVACSWLSSYPPSFQPLPEKRLYKAGCVAARTHKNGQLE